MIPDRTHARIIQSGDGSSRAMLAETMKIPDPIIEPATSIVASVRVIALTNPVPECGVASVETAELLIHHRKKREGVDGGCRRRFRHNPTKSRGALGPPLDRWEGIGLVQRGHARRLRTRIRPAPSCAAESHPGGYPGEIASRGALQRCACCSHRRACA